MSNLITAVIVAALMLGAAHLYGMNRYEAGQRDIIREIEQARAASVEEKERINEEIDALSDDELLDRARGWVRGDTSR